MAIAEYDKPVPVSTVKYNRTAMSKIEMKNKKQRRERGEEDKENHTLGKDPRSRKMSKSNNKKL